MWGCSGYSSGWMGLGMIGTALFWIFIILGIIALMKSMWSSRGSISRGPEETALDTLKKRYARGEVDKEEFAQKKRDLAD